VGLHSDQITLIKEYKRGMKWLLSYSPSTNARTADRDHHVDGLTAGKVVKKSDKVPRKGSVFWATAWENYELGLRE